MLLRSFVLADVPSVFAMSQELGMRRFIPDQVYRDEAHAEQVVRTLIDLALERSPQTKPYVLAVEHAGQLVGHVGLSPARGSVEIGYAIAETQQGRGLATEAVVAMTERGLVDFCLPEVLGIVDEANASSRRVLEKAGYVYSESANTKRIYRRISASR